MREKTCAILSCDPMSFPWGYDEEDEGCAALKLLLLNRITVLRSGGVTEFAVVMDSGVGLYAAEIINGLRETDTDMRLTCVVPWEEQATKWTPDLRERYFNTLAECSEAVTVSTERTEDCEVIAMLNAIDLAEEAIIVKDGADLLTAVAVHYAQRIGKRLQTISINNGRLSLDTYPEKSIDVNDEK